MAVFPDRIVLKNSTDAEAAIIAAIETGGTDEITQGEIVLGLGPAEAKLYTKGQNGDIVSIGNDVGVSASPPGAGLYVFETQAGLGGVATFSGLGYSGILQKVSSTLDAWIVLYSSAAARTADAGRAYNTDPEPGSGVLFEAYVLGNTVVTPSPGTTYLNNDTALTEAIYAAVRDANGNPVEASVTIYAYGLAAITAVSGGTFGSGL